MKHKKKCRKIAILEFLSTSIAKNQELLERLEKDFPLQNEVKNINQRRTRKFSLAFYQEAQAISLPIRNVKECPIVDFPLDVKIGLLSC